MNRKEFLYTVFILALPEQSQAGRVLMTVNGPIPVKQAGYCLVHEHVLVDFIGADKINYSRWDREAVMKKVIPYLLQAKKAGVKTFVDCTPAFLGRDVMLLKLLSRETGLQIVTNTGYYGAVKNKYLPPFAFTESAEQLAARWIAEFKYGIEGTGIKPGFIKTAVDSDAPLSAIHRKLVTAAAITHLETGLAIFSHTGPARAAFEQLEILKEKGVHPSSFVWVHAQAEQDQSNHIKAANAGCWVSLDGMGWGNIDRYVELLQLLKKEKLLHRVLVSHDAGWYKPGEPEAEFKGYTNIFTELIPALKKIGFTKRELDQLLIKNPAETLGL